MRVHGWCDVNVKRIEESPWVGVNLAQAQIRLLGAFCTQHSFDHDAIDVMSRAG